jgi:capsular polysaccharide biosynthesis protein
MTTSILRPVNTMLLVVAIIAPVALGVAGSLWAAASPELYEAQSTMVVRPSGLVADDVRLSLDATDILRTPTLVSTLATLAETEAFLVAVGAELGITADEIDEISVEAAAPPGAAIVELTVAAPERTRAIDLGDALVARLADDFGGSYPVLEIAVLESSAPDEATDRIPLAIGLLAGLVIGAVVAWLALSLRVYLDARQA